MADWRAIETAPHNGTAVLVFDPLGKWRVTISTFREGWGWETWPGKIPVKPTLWQPLPDLPQ